MIVKISLDPVPIDREMDVEGWAQPEEIQAVDHCNRGHLALECLFQDSGSVLIELNGKGRLVVTVKGWFGCVLDFDHKLGAGGGRSCHSRRRRRGTAGRRGCGTLCP